MSRRTEAGAQLRGVILWIKGKAVVDKGAAVHSRIRIRPADGGEEVQTEIVDIVRFEGDRIASFKQFADTALAARMRGH